MRKITSQSIEAFNNNLTFHKSNMSVEYSYGKTKEFYMVFER